MKAACSFDRPEAIALLPAFENGNQFVERPLIVLRTRLQIFFQYELGFPNGLNGQLLVGHTQYSLIGPRSNKRAKSRLHSDFSPLFRKVRSHFRVVPVQYATVPRQYG